MQNASTFASLGTLSPAYISINDADLYIVSGYDAAVASEAATIRAFIAAGGGVLVGSQARLGGAACLGSSLSGLENAMPWARATSPTLLLCPTFPAV